MKKIVVLGGGISGLAAAWRLSHQARGLQVVLLESSDRVGGWMHSVRTKEGAVLELGPRSLRIAGTAGKTTLSLVSEVGLAEDVLPVPPSHKGVSRRLIYTRDHGLVELPSSVSWLFRTKPPFSRPLLPAVLAEIFRRKRKSSEDESVYDFISRRLGSEIADYVIDPMCRGIFAGSARNLSMHSAFPAIHQYETSHGSIIRGAMMTKTEPVPESAPDLVKQAVGDKWAVYSLRSGLESLPRAMLAALQDRGVEVHLEQACTAVHFPGDGVQVECSDKVYEADHVVSALPSHILSGLLPEAQSLLSHHLHTIPAVTVGVVCLEFRGHALPPEYEEAFGYLVPSHQPASILGVVFDSSTFPEHNRPGQASTRCTVSIASQCYHDHLDDRLVPRTIVQG
jgi:oxygen-dependent protoporphyrinogen oxidase